LYRFRLGMTQLKNFLNASKLLEWNGSFHCQKGMNFDSFETSYISVRQKEKRLYSDEEASTLPVVSNNHPHRLEWLIRERSVSQLIKYLRNRKVATILEIGCGNGWMTHQLVEALSVEVCAIDVNGTELEQGARIFKDERINFLQADIFSDVLPKNYFDVIVLGSSVQYFKDLPSLVSRIFELLKPQGEIHIFDSPFYRNASIGQARHRSELYFIELGHPEMTANYFHHQLDELSEYSFSHRYDPSNVLNKLKRKFIPSLSPFPWIVINAGTSGILNLARLKTKSIFSKLGISWLRAFD